MTIEQASDHFGVPIEKLQTYENQGLFDCNRQPDGTIDYSEELMEYVGIINILTDAGAEADALRGFMRQLMESTITKEEKLRYLRRQQSGPAPAAAPRMGRTGAVSALQSQTGGHNRRGSRRDRPG